MLSVAASLLLLYMAMLIAVTGSCPLGYTQGYARCCFRDMPFEVKDRVMPVVVTGSIVVTGSCPLGTYKTRAC